MKRKRGASLVEVLVTMLIIVTACIATLAFFTYGMSQIGTEGDRRAALERARGRLEELLAASSGAIHPPDNQINWLSCAGAPCAWTRFTTPVFDTVNLNTLQNQRMETTAQWIDDLPAGTAGLDEVELVVKVWFTPNFGVDDEFNRVHLRALRDV